MHASSTCRFAVAPAVMAVIALGCSDPAPPATPTLESLALSLDSIAVQWRDSASEVTASPRGALGVELEANVTWRSKDSRILTVVPNGKSVRLIPVHPGVTEVEASAEQLVSTAKVVVLDTVYSVTLSAPDTIVTMGRSLQFTATVTGPPGASQRVSWSVGNSSVARIDSSGGKNPVLVVSLDTGATTVTATSAIDRKKSAPRRFRTAGPAELYFESQPGDAIAPIRANDILIPGPVVKARDVLGQPYPGNLDITMTILPGTGTAGAALFGTPYVTTSNGEARFENLGVDSSGTGFRLFARAAGVAGSSAPFSVGPECPGIPYAIGSVVTGTLTSNSCQARADVYYNRYIVSASATGLISGLTPTTSRWGVVFGDGTRSSTQTDTTPHLVTAGKYSIRLYSGPNGQMGDYELRTRFANLGKQAVGQQGYVCWTIQTAIGIVFDEELRCQDVLFACGTSRTVGSPYRLFLQPNVRAVVSASSSAFDPCLEVRDGQTGQQIAVDNNSGGGTTARIVLAPSPNSRAVVVWVTGPPPVPASSPFTIRITP